MRRLRLALLVPLLLFAPAARAGKLYVGLGAGDGSIRAGEPGTRVDASDTGYRVYVGYRLRRLAFEAGYADLGEFSETTGAGVAFAAEASLIRGYLVGNLLVTPRLELFAKAGLARWDVKTRFDDGAAPPVVRDENGTDFAYGFGLSYRVTRRVVLLLERERFDFGSIADGEMTSLNAELRF